MNDVQCIGRALSAIPAPIFLARTSGSRHIDVYTTDRSATGRIRRQVEAALTASRIAMTCRVIALPMRRIERYRTLEALVAGLGKGTIVYDPTHVARRAESLVDLACRLRKVVGEQTRALLFEPGRRTLYVIVDRDAYPRPATDRLAARQATVKSAAEVFSQWRQTRQSGFDLAIRIGYEAPPATTLVSVDSPSVGHVLRRLVRGRRGGLALRAVAASLLGLGVSVPAGAEGPAVSEPNLTVLLFGTSYDLDVVGDGSVAGVAAKAAVPLGHSFGAQFDAAFGTDSYYGAGGHLFWRDPSVGLLGAIASYNTLDGVDMFRYGVEGEAYVNRFTIGARAGGQSGDVPEGFWGEIDVTFYATPAFSLSAGIATDPNRTLATGGFEWQPASFSMPGLSVFADTRVGDDEWQATAGLKFHFGSSKTLIDRDRRADPTNLTLVYPTKY